MLWMMKHVQHQLAGIEPWIEVGIHGSTTGFEPGTLESKVSITKWPRSEPTELKSNFVARMDRCGQLPHNICIQFALLSQEALAIEENLVRWRSRPSEVRQSLQHARFPYQWIETLQISETWNELVCHMGCTIMTKALTLRETWVSSRCWWGLQLSCFASCQICSLLIDR